ncbi:MAG: type III-B CRISPR module RAMP protein Cmr1 [Nitrososphaerales archaeon]
MSSWLLIQEKIAKDHEFIAEIDVETITFTRIGGYKATPYSLKLNLLNALTAKSLKGVWRWWARTAIVGAYNGKVNYKKANEELNKILVSPDKGVSLFRLEIFDFPTNLEANLTQINNEIDNFYEKAKDFLMNQEAQLGLPNNTKVSVTLNPSTSAVIIEHDRIPLNQHKDRIDKLIKQGPLKDYFLSSKLGKKDYRIVITLRFPKSNDYLQIPRVRLLLMKRGKEEEDSLNRTNIDSEKITRYMERVKEEMAALVSKGLKFKILLYGNKDSEKVNFALSSLLLSLILGGVGSMTKRAFGSLRLLSFRFKDELKINQEIRKIFQDLQGKEFTKDELKETLEDLCNITINFAKRLLNISGIQEFNDIPIVPSLSNIKIEVIECSSLDPVKIGNAFVKQTWKQSFKMKGRNLHTWILGLPRFQEETGYARKINYEYETLRRISSIGARCFKTQSKNFIIVFGLLSDDWPKDLLHIRRKNQPDREKLVRDIPIGNSPQKGNFLQNVYDYAFEKVKKLCQI